MVAKEFSCLKPVQENTNLQDFDDEEGETLSLCDLAVDSNAADYWNDFSKEEQRSSSTDQGFFEFFSEDFTASTYPTDNIIFCGKLIPYGESITIPQNNHNTETPTKQEKPKNSCIFPWKSHSFNKSRYLSSNPQQETKSYKTSLSTTVSESHAKCSEKFDFSVKKVSVMATPLKSRWHLFAFGSVGRFPMEMELKDMKTRQSRRGPATTFRSKDNGGEDKTRRRGKGLWGLLRI